MDFSKVLVSVNALKPADEQNASIGIVYTGNGL